ncbi:N-acetylmuramoyl-L-alanine amidase [Myxococcus sp. K15C18031901]|uniref:N-acetylmuramoyl-L-alanine amidase family protein n=1 Tax=Myxococcus dinghuensis TaxID=2906761 RepID=UPI0020A7AA5E|nr:N-acetylmuramoyl-L-alanine amidase [Myxococcus dinghuensis]MCP3100435.1 N-acetylmuramoyl-L-alanine amidase [Myxococcus dinghuensis]
MTKTAGLRGLGLLLLTSAACVGTAPPHAPPEAATSRDAATPPPPAVAPSPDGARALDVTREGGVPLVEVPPRWPAPGSRLMVPEVRFPAGFGKRRIYLDAGHGAEGNTGTRSVTCEDEEVFTLRAAEDLAQRLEATGHFTVRLSRKAGARVPYAQRLAEAERWGADVLVSLHSDSRGLAHTWSPAPGQECFRQDETPGFSVLWSEDATPPLQTRRALLARALARSMTRAGFLGYDGMDYTGLYAVDTAQAGVFVSREPTHRQIFVLRKPRIPSVIIETHHALDFEESARWREARTLETFAAAVAQGLVESFTVPKE